MLSFELSAIDIILVVAVLVLFLLYWTKLSTIPEKNLFRGLTTQNMKQKKNTEKPQNGYAECPRGFGHIKRIDDDGSVSERCLGCYRIMECYGEGEAVTLQVNESSDTNNRYI
jgi:hypothetical protein